MNLGAFCFCRVKKRWGFPSFLLLQKGPPAGKSCFGWDHLFLIVLYIDACIYTFSELSNGI